MSRNVKILTLLQICTFVAIIAGAWFYANPRQSSASAPALGIVDGIVFTPENSSVLIDGQVLKAGDAIYGVKVAEIGKCIVTFEKNGKRWEQRVRQRPNLAWDEPDPPAESLAAPDVGTPQASKYRSRSGPTQSESDVNVVLDHKAY